MTAPDPPSPPDDSLETLRRLVNTALHDRSLYCPQVGYWQTDERAVADDAADAIVLQFSGRDPSAAELTLLGNAVASANGVDLIEKLLRRLEAKAMPLIFSLLQDASPDRRAAAVRLASHVLTPETWLSASDDAAPVVRVAVVEALAGADGMSADDPRCVPDYKERVRRALADPSAEVREAAARSRYPDTKRNAIVARMIANTDDAWHRTRLGRGLIETQDWDIAHWTKASFGDAIVRCELVKLIAAPNPELRTIAIQKIDRLIDALPRDEDVSDFCIALFEQLLVERSLPIVDKLLRVQAYPRVTGHIIGRLSELLPDHLPKLPFDAPRFLKRFGPAALPLLERLATGTGYFADHARESLDAIRAAERSANQPGRNRDSGGAT